MARPKAKIDLAGTGKALRDAMHRRGDRRVLRRQHADHRAPAQGASSSARSWSARRRRAGSRCAGACSVWPAAGNIAAAIFLAKNLLGYHDVVNNEHSGPGGGPIQIASETRSIPTHR